MSALLDGAVGRLERRLAGPRRVRRDMVAEVRDGLLSAAAAHEEAGLEPDTAARRALEEFGDVDWVADELQHELTARAARRTAIVAALAFLPLALAWDLAWTVQPEAVAGPTTLPTLVDLVQLMAGLAAVALAVALRRPLVPPWTLRAAGTLGVATPAVLGACSATMLAIGHFGAGPVMPFELVAALSLPSAAALGGSLVMGRRSLQLSAATGP